MLNLRANTAALSFITCSVPMFVAGQVTLGIAFSLGSIACGNADTASAYKHRVSDFFTALALFFLNSFAVTSLYHDTLAFSLYLAFASFNLFMFAVFSPRLGAIGFATILAGIYALILHDGTRPDWYIPAALAAGCMWYGMWQWLAFKCFPHREDLDLFFDVNQALSKKLLSHSWPLTHYADDGRDFVDAARLRSLFAANFGQLKARVHQELAAGENNEQIVRLQAYLQVAESVSEQTRLMHFSPGKEFQQHYGRWLTEIDSVTRTIAESIAGLQLDRPKALLPEIDFHVLRQVPLDGKFDHEVALAGGFIDKLELIYLAMRSLDDYRPKKCEFRVRVPHRGQSMRALRFGLHKFLSQFSWQSSYFRHAFRGTVSLTAGFILVRMFNLEFGFWTLMTSLLVLRPTMSMTWQRLLHRLAGTIGGLLAVAFMLHANMPHWLLPVIFCLAAVVFFHTSAKNYGVAVFCVTVYVFMGFALNGEGAVILLPRLENTLLGVALPVVLLLLISPGWQKNAFPSQLYTAIDSYRRFLVALETSQFGNRDENSASHSGLPAKFQRCVREDTNLFDHWLGYLGEPGQKGKISETIVLCCRASNVLLRQITAINGRLDSFEDAGCKEALHSTVESMEALCKRLESRRTSESFYDFIHDRKGRLYQKINRIENDFQNSNLKECLFSISYLCDDLLV
ncbi:FUSC family protein [Parasalinivibrio latis]|uniref:FUSC family membrane protein n=1 Tax=Parasalinivibrio latis TaxID=2952610 RepID=UPI0030DEBA7E